MILVGGLLVLLSGVLAIAGLPTGVSFTDGHLMIQLLQGISIYHGIIETLSGIILIAAAFYIRYKNATMVQNWLIAGLVFSIISLMGGGGFFIGFVLALMGSTFGIVYEYLSMGRYIYVRHGRMGSVKNKLTVGAGAPVKVLNSLTVDEKRLYRLIEEANGAIFQADLVEKSGFSKVKVSRVLDRLEGRDLIVRRRRGMTNMVVISRETNQ